jgi:hypothetical protein
MQRTIRARMLNKLIYLLNNTDIESLEYEVKQQNIKSKYTLLFTVICEKTVDIFCKNHNLNREEVKKQLEQDYDIYLKHSEQFIDDEFLRKQ